MNPEYVTCPNPACGQRLPAQAKWCKFCGTVLSDAAADSPVGAAAGVTPRAASERPVAWPELTPQRLSGVINGIVMLTPESIVTLPNPWAWAPRAEVKVNLSLGATLLHSATRGSTRLGVYQGGLLFPPVCPASGAPATGQLMVEAAVVHSGLGKVSFPNMPAPLLARVSTALTADRYWFCVPFAAGRGAKDRAVGFAALTRSGNHSQAVVQCTSREYARAFVALNGLSGARWLQSQHLLSQALGAVLVVAGLGILLGSALARSSGGQVVGFPPLLNVASVLAVAGGVVLFIRGIRGEPL